jgi:hypothetical protein
MKVHVGNRRTEYWAESGNEFMVLFLSIPLLSSWYLYTLPMCAEMTLIKKKEIGVQKLSKR